MREFNYPKFTLGESLTQEQLAFFDEHGFIHFKSFITKERVAEIIKGSHDVQKQWIAENREKVNGVPIKWGFDLDGSKIVQRFAFSSLFSPTLHELLKDPRFKSLFPFLGKKVSNPRVGEYEKDGLVLNHYINTENSKFSQMGWHTDSLRDVFYGKKIMPMLNVGIHLDRSTTDNGGLRLIPGTHKQSLRQLLFRKKYFLDYEPDPEEIGLNVDPGDLTVHDGRLWHRVALSPLVGEISRRRVMYVPFITGKFKPRDENSKPRLYQRFMYLLK
ncbi:MAG: phytanoyl-CoA dioxygenase [Cytophagales bacterium]|nr:MAG: phytanoyl-CoA dioxygenase [Bacteroidota bacterium]TAH31487.1 MAG: phytanoyl-CoA dioxygenase [Cytophagales bacterium]